jgi:molybdopterin/thiamine biosynthesis adenylyltransferase
MPASTTFHEIGASPATSTLHAPPPRGARFPGLLGLSEAPDPSLDAVKLALIGTGSVGRNIALHAARLHPHTLWLVDRGRFKAESLLTQPIAPADLSEPKASNTARLCKSISRDTRIFAFDGPIEHLDLPALIEADLVISATDNLAAEVEIGRRCLRLRRPLVQASVHGETLVAQVRFFGNRDGAGPCPVCAFGNLEWTLLHKQTQFSCEGPGSEQPAPEVSQAPTMSLSFLCSLAADLAMVQILRHILGLGSAVEDTVLEYCGYTHKTSTAPLMRRPECHADHTPFTDVAPHRPLEDCTLRQLAQATRPGEAGEEGLTGVSWTIENATFVEWGGCPCGHRQRIGRFLASGEDAGVCDACGDRVHPDPFYKHATVPAALALPWVDQPLATLGVRSAAWVIVRDGERAAILRTSHAKPTPQSSRMEVPDEAS